MSYSFPVGGGSGSRRALPTLVVVQVLVAAIALVVLILVAFQLRPLLQEKARLENEVPELRGEVTDLRQELAVLRSELDAARKRLEETADLTRAMHEVDLVDAKHMASRYPRAAEALLFILELRRDGVTWQLGGQSPNVGFDSPSFAAFVLEHFGTIPGGFQVDRDLLATSRKLLELLETTSEPAIGDLVFYPSGYVMFLFEDAEGSRFVIGMTPFGIATVEPDFARVVAYRRSGLSS